MSFCVPHCSSLSNLFPMLSHRYKRCPVHSSFLTTFLQVGLLWPRGYTWKCGQVVPDFSSTSVISKGFGIELCAFKNLQSWRKGSSEKSTCGKIRPIIQDWLSVSVCFDIHCSCLGFFGGAASFQHVVYLSLSLSLLSTLPSCLFGTNISCMY